MANISDNKEHKGSIIMAYNRPITIRSLRLQGWNSLNLHQLWKQGAAQEAVRESGMRRWWNRNPHEDNIQELQDHPSSFKKYRYDSIEWPTLLVVTLRIVIFSLIVVPLLLNSQELHEKENFKRNTGECRWFSGKYIEFYTQIFIIFFAMATAGISNIWPILWQNSKFSSILLSSFS